MPLLRLDKIISDMGIASRRDAKALIKSGRVTVDNNVVNSVDIKIDTEKSCVTINGSEVVYKEYSYIMLNKPTGYVCAAEDKRDRTVMELLDTQLNRQKLFSVGRLDKDTEGLLIMTNDGDYAHKVISPKSEIIKRYYTKVNGVLEEADIIRMRDGLVLADGTKCLPAGLDIISENECVVSVCEGKYHQVKKMMACLGKPVVYLKRLSVGWLRLDENLTLGSYRELTESEVALALKTGPVNIE